MHNGSAIFRIILQFAWLVAASSLNWVAWWSCNWQNLRPFEGVFGHILHKKYPPKNNNLCYLISLVFLPFVEKQTSLLENLTMEVRYYVALADPLFFFCVCVCVCLCRSEVDLVIREDCYPFCSGYATKGDMSQRRKSRELSGH